MKQMADVHKSWMQTKWTDLQPDAAAQQLQTLQAAQAQAFAEGLPEVHQGISTITAAVACGQHAHNQCF